MDQGKAGSRIGRRGAQRMALLGLALTALMAMAGTAAARKGDARAGIFIGTTTFTVDGYRTFGTQFGGYYGFEVADDLLWSFGGRFAATEGTEQVVVGGTPQTVQLQASTAAFRTGLAAYFNTSGAVIPFLGGGLSYLNYDLKYGGTSIGNTSGSGPGAFADAGIEFRLTRSFTIIPQFGIEVHTIRTESGLSKGLLSGGLVFTLRISG